MQAEALCACSALPAARDHQLSRNHDDVIVLVLAEIKHFRSPEVEVVWRIKWALPQTGHCWGSAASNCTVALDSGEADVLPDHTPKQQRPANRSLRHNVGGQRRVAGRAGADAWGHSGRGRGKRPGNRGRRAGTGRRARTVSAVGGRPTHICSHPGRRIQKSGRAPAAKTS